jgi:hypothetical protein
MTYSRMFEILRRKMEREERLAKAGKWMIEYGRRTRRMLARVNRQRHVRAKHGWIARWEKRTMQPVPGEDW